MPYTIKKIASMSGVTLRTLRYYDKIGLLKPSGRTEAGYRLYNEDDIEKLQHILFFRELDFPLQKIDEMINNPAFDKCHALRMHIEFLDKRSQRYKNLAKLAKETLKNIEGGIKMSDDKLFNGFDYEKIVKEQKQYEQEVKQRWGNTDAYKVSAERTAKYSKEDWWRISAEQERNLNDLIECYKKGVAYDDPRMLDIVKRAIAVINDNFYPCSVEMMSNLGTMYIQDERFKAYYDKHAQGLAEYYNNAIQHYCIANS